MPLLYFMIVCNNKCFIKINLEQDETNSLETLVASIIKQIKYTQSKMSYVYDKYTFYYFFPKPSFLILTVSDERFERKMIFTFLEKLIKDIDLDFSEEGKNNISEKIESKNLISIVQQKIINFSPKSDENMNSDDVINMLKTNVTESIDRIIAKEVVVDLLYTPTNINENAHVRRQRHLNRKRKRRWRNIKRITIFVIILLLLIYFVSAFTCGGFSYQFCRNKSIRRI